MCTDSNSASSFHLTDSNRKPGLRLMNTRLSDTFLPYASTPWATCAEKQARSGSTIKALKREDANDIRSPHRAYHLATGSKLPGLSIAVAIIYPSAEDPNITSDVVTSAKTVVETIYILFSETFRSTRSNHCGIVVRKEA